VEEDGGLVGLVGADNGRIATEVGERNSERFHEEKELKCSAPTLVDLQTKLPDYITATQTYSQSKHSKAANRFADIVQ